MLSMIHWRALVRSRLLTVVPVRSPDLRLHKAVLAHSIKITSRSSIVDLDICLVVLHVLINLIRSPPVDRVFPALVKLRVFASHIVMQDWRVIHGLERTAWVLSMHVIIAAWAAHFDHIHDVLRVGVFLLSQIEHFEFLPHWRIVPCCLNIAERTERLLRLAIFLGMCKALVLLDLGEPCFFFHTEFYIVKRFIWKSD